MKTYYIACKKDTENKNPKIFKTKIERLGIRTPLSKMPGLNILF